MYNKNISNFNVPSYVGLVDEQMDDGVFREN